MKTEFGQKKFVAFRPTASVHTYIFFWQVGMRAELLRRLDAAVRDPELPCFTEQVARHLAKISSEQDPTPLETDR